MKSKITKIGRIINSQPQGFSFDCTGGGIPLIEVTDDNKILLCGWSLEELKRMSTVDFN